VDLHWIERLPPGECEQSLGKTGGPLSAALRIVERAFYAGGSCIIVGAKLALCGFEISQDNHQKIVEVMRHTACQFDLTGLFWTKRLSQIPSIMKSFRSSALTG
jgi:hypothetical protein